MGLYRRRTGGAGDALYDGTFAGVPRLANTDGTDFGLDFSADYCRVLHWLARPLGRFNLAHNARKFRPASRARDFFAGNANFVFGLRARNHVFLWFVKQVSAHGDGGRICNRSGAIGRPPPLCRTWNRSGPRTRAW